ncbi:hypothetical protein [Candidatus Liberibacter sp.]|uniref:hypothetical protein n=1 Tax=Candidatus Liberibacter sp. TaxID=34022 RepID=UPI0015F40FE3|nr:hypothetical protein [Candidatus Liberibacter sp.]MBA5724379.1 hypothetical protein [Candidatus Liberibacter sp.]
MIYNPALIMMIMIVGSAFNGYTNGIIIYLADKFYHKTRWAKVILFLFSLQLSQALDIACIYGSYYVVSLILYGTFFGTAIYRLRGAKSEIHISNKEENS